MKNKSKLTRRCNQIVFSFIALVLITFSSLLQASPLSKEEQAHVIIVTSPTAQKLQKLADDIGTDIYFYVEGLTGKTGGKIGRSEGVIFVPSIITSDGDRISSTASIPKITVLLNESGEAIHAISGGRAKLSKEILFNLMDVEYLGLWGVDFRFEHLNLSLFTKLKRLRVTGGEIKTLSLPKYGTLTYAIIESGTLVNINYLSQQKILQYLYLNAKESIDYKYLEKNESLTHLILMLNIQTIAIETLINLKEVTLYNPKGNDIENISKLNKLKYLTLKWPEDRGISTVKLPKSLEILMIMNPHRYSLMPLVNLPNLKEVTFNGGDITQVPILEDLPQLETLEISDSKLTSLDGIEKLTSLKYVRFEKNEITDISALFPLENLIEIDLSDSKFKRLEYIGKKPHLDILKLSDSELESVDFDAIAKYPYCSISIEFTPFEMNASDDDLDKIYNLWEKGHL
uniref:Internalin-A n=1 Tax=Aliivibrio wodanis TaxID=80852 RepID=A0A5Q4ZX65_9GAMM|nr:Internalin-A [Aliivibrio wodanis]